MDFPSTEQYKGLIFDLDGTLINSMPYHVIAWIKVCKEHGFEIDPKVIYAMGGVTSRDVVMYFKSQGHDVGDIDEFIKRKVELYRENFDKVQFFPKVLDILLKARERGAKIAVGSGTQLKNAVDILAVHGMTDKIDALVTAEMVSEHKPAPQTFLLCAQKMNLAPEQCIVFEDGPLGIKAALNGNMPCIEVKDGEFVKFYEP